MVTVLLTHEVKNFEDRKKGFDSDEANRTGAGVTVNGVYTSIDNPNLVTISTNFAGIEAVQGFMSNPQLAADMEVAGVVGKPEVKILQQR